MRGLSTYSASLIACGGLRGGPAGGRVRRREPFRSVEVTSEATCRDAGGGVQPSQTTRSLRAAQNAFMTRLFAPDKDVRLAISDAQQDNSKQVAQVETFIRQKPDLLIVAPMNGPR